MLKAHIGGLTHVCIWVFRPLQKKLVKQWIALQIKGEYIELIKLLKLLRLVESGGIAKLVVEDGMVSLNGEVEYRKRAKIRVGDQIEFEGQTILIK